MEVPYRGRYEKIERMGNGAYGVIHKIKDLTSLEMCIAKHIPLHNIDRTKAIQEVYMSISLVQNIGEVET